MMNNAVKAQELLTWDGFPKICVPVVETTQDGITRLYIKVKQILWSGVWTFIRISII